MFLAFFHELRRRKVPVSTHEWMALMRGLELGLHESSLDGFYQLARALCVKDLGHYDAFDEAFLTVFHDLQKTSIELTEELRAWLADPRRLEGLTPEQLAAMKALDLDELRRLFEERLREQKERHDGGSKWIGTGGTSPFGSGGRHPSGMRVGEGGGRSAMQVAAERRFRGYRSDEVLDVRQVDVALRLLRDLGRDGAPSELDLDETIDRTARNAGDLDVVLHSPRRNRAKVILLMDVGGSMDPYAQLVNRLFTAASRAGRFARFRSYYFHNCVYQAVYHDPGFRDELTVNDLIHGSDRDERLVIVGDAAMHPGELLQPGGSIYYYGPHQSAAPGIDTMRRLADYFRRSAWLNPEPPFAWDVPTVGLLRRVFPMFALTIDGLQAAVRHLVRGGARPE